MTLGGEGGVFNRQRFRSDRASGRQDEERQPDDTGSDTSGDTGIEAVIGNT